MYMDYALRRRWIKQLITLAVVGGAILAFFIPTTVASQPIDPCDALGGCSDTLIESADQDTVEGSITEVVLSVVRLLIFISAGIAVLFMVFAGFRMVTSNGDAEQFKKGKETLIAALVGFVICVISISIITLVGSILQGDLFGGGTTTTTSQSADAVPR